VLLSIIEEQEPDRSAILEGIFSKSRGELVENVERAPEGSARALAKKVLRAHDFVYDLRDQPASAA
jgi:hypothetical protein